LRMKRLDEAYKIIECGKVDFEEKDIVKGRSVLNWVCNWGMKDFVHKLIEKNALLESVDWTGFTPLLTAVNAG